MSKPDAITRRWGNEKSGVDERIFHPGQLQDNDQDNANGSTDKNTNEDVDKDVDNDFDDATGHAQITLLMPFEGDDIAEVDDIDIEAIDCAKWERNEAGLLRVPEEHKRVVLRQCHNSKVAGH